MVQTVWIQVNVDSFFVNTVQSYKCIFSYGFLNTFFSLAYLIVKNRACNTYNIHNICWLFMLLLKFLINSMPLVVWGVKIMCRFLIVQGLSAPNSCVVQGSTIKTKNVLEKALCNTYHIMPHLVGTVPFFPFQNELKLYWVYLSLSEGQINSIPFTI